jgi:acyl-CoA dehydrogenase
MNKPTRDLDPASPIASGDGPYTAEHEMFRDTVRRFIKEKIEPYYKTWEKTDIGVPVTLWRDAGSAGLLGLRIPESYGGPGCDRLYSVVLTEEMGGSIAGCSIGSTAFSADLITEMLIGFGSEEQKRRYFPTIMTGETVQCAGITEPAGGSDVNAMRSRARLDADEYVINGQKTFISNALQANLCYFLAKTDNDVNAGRGRMTMFLIPMDAPGFERRRLDTLGEKGGSVCELFLTDVRVPRSAIVGEEGKALSDCLSVLFNADRVLIGVRAQAIAELAFNLTLDYVQERQAFGRRIFDFQNTQFKLAEMKTKLIVGKAFKKSLIHQLLAGTLEPMTASAAKIWLPEMLFEIANECLQLHGGYGYMSDSAICKIFTFARLQTIYAGTSEIQKGAIARLLG